MSDGFQVIDQHATLGHTRAKHWLFRVWDPRSRRRKSRAFEKLAEGHAWARQLRARFSLGQASAGTLPFALVAEDYLVSLTERGLVAGHLREIRLVCEAVVAAGCTDLLAESFAPAVRKWISTAPTFAPGREAPLSNITRNRWLKHLKSVCLHAVRHPRQFPGLAFNPLHAVKPLKIDHKIKTTLSLDELRDLVSPRMGPLPPAHGPVDPYFLPACLMIYAGLRVGEAHHVRWEWIDFEARTISIQVRPEYRLKRNKERHVPLLDELHDLLAAWPSRAAIGWVVDDAAAREGGARLVERRTKRRAWEVSEVARRNKEHWLSFREYVARCGHDARTLHPHSTRHTWVALMLATGASATHVRRAAGHSSLKTTDEYANAEAAFATAVRGWDRGQFYLRRAAPGTALEDPLDWLRLYLQRGGSIEALAETSAVPVPTLMAWLRQGPPPAVRQHFAARHAAAAARPTAPAAAARGTAGEG